MAAMSSTVPKRRTGMLDVSCIPPSGYQDMSLVVSIRPGEMTFTRMFLGPNSEASPLASPMMPILAADTWARVAEPTKAPSPVKKTTRPYSFFSMCGMAAWTQ